MGRASRKKQQRQRAATRRPAKADTSHQKRPVRHYLYLLIIVAATALVYSGSLSGDFTNWDDDLYVTENPLITELSTERLQDYFTTPIAGNFHPLTMISLGLDYRWGGLDPFIYHFKNLLLHLLNSVLVFFLVLRLSGGRPLTALFTALAFGVHAMHVESVAWISERKDVLYTFYFLGGLLLYYRYLDTRKAGFFLLSALAFVLSGLAKSAAVVFPVVLLLIDLYESRKPDWKMAAEKVPLFACSVWLGLKALETQAASKALGDFAYFSLFEKMQLASYGFFNYIVKFFVPHRLSAFHPYPEELAAPVFKLSLAAMVALIIYMVWRGRKYRQLWFGLLFYAVTIALVLQFITVGDAIIAERYTYVPYIGLGFAVFHYLEILLQRARRPLKQVLYSLLAGFIAFTAVSAYLHVGNYSDSAALWTQVIRLYPDESGAYSNRGQYYRTIEKRDLALADYNRAIQLDDGNSRAYSNRAKIYFDRAQYDLALSDYERALEEDDVNKDALNGMGAILFSRNQYREALEYIDRAIELDPANRDYIKNRGITYYTLGQYETALSDFDRYLQMAPTDADITNSLGLCHLNAGRPSESIAHFSRAIGLNGSQGAFYYNRSRAYFRMGNLSQARADAGMAEQQGFTVNPQYLYQLQQAGS